MGLDEKIAAELSEITVQRTLSLHVEDHIIVKKLKEISSVAERELILNMLFQIAKEDLISETESEEIRLISRGLGITNEAFIQMRSKYKSDLSIFKK